MPACLRKATFAIIVIATLACSWGQLQAAARPNIILIFIDDLGWKDVGCYGSSFIDTPRIDQLAQEGIRFTDFYAAGTVCSPTRCAVQSGQNQARIGITDFISGHWRPFERVITPRPTMALPLDTVTVAESLQSAGYETGYIGKWHLGNGARYHPSQQGYDFAAVIGGPHLPGQFRVGGNPNLKPEPNQYRTEFEAQLSSDFIKKNKNEPFFLMVSPYAVHIPLGAMSKKVEKYRAQAEARGTKLPNPVYAAMVEHCDDLVGQIVDTVEAEGLTDKTMIVFTSDNGGLYRRYDYHNPEVDDTVADLSPLRGEKGNLYEGGIRVPLIVKFPPKIKAGSISREPTISYDFYPTFVNLAGGELPSNQSIDGMDLSPLFQDPRAQLDRDAIHWHYPHYHHGRPASCIRARDWKLIEYHDQSGDIELFEISKDLSESNELSTQLPARTNELRKQLQNWRQRVLAAMPIPNPSYDSDRAHEWWSTRTGKPVPSHLRKKYPPTEKDL